MALMVMQGALISSNYFVLPCPQLRDNLYTGLHRQLGLLLRPLNPVTLTTSCQGGRQAKSQRLTCRAAVAAAATVVGNDGSLANSNGNARLPPSPFEATLAKIIPYLWNLASSDTTLRWRLAAALVLLFASKTAGLAGPVLFKQAMDELAKAPLDRTTPVLVALVFAALSKAISSGLNEVHYIIFAPLGQATGHRVGVELLNHILHRDLTFHLERRTAALSRILDCA